MIVRTDVILTMYCAHVQRRAAEICRRFCFESRSDWSSRCRGWGRSIGNRQYCFVNSMIETSVKNLRILEGISSRSFSAF
ncbi:unnamed protein product [Parnassius apollo]|uniref:(apollo) hypothetical protein n=1 Tax=Parnassius apollo TaxID=110799 RepID=A0A8S3X6D2_PARAO|nr:unnamed protein product [Parnassius apollo]